jgi:hypothetical protein
MPELHPCFEGFPQNALGNGQLLQGGLIPPMATQIIMGTFPPPAVMLRFWDGNPFFFYNSSRNHFWNRIENFVPYQNNLRWKWLDIALETEAENIARKVQLALDRGWAFMDFFSEIDRLENNANDENLVNIDDVVVNNQLFAALEAVPTISTIYCTYTTALTGIMNALHQSGYALNEELEEMSANGLKYTWNFQERLIAIILLYPASRSVHPAELKNQQYAHYLQL